jgi:tetratricopeptide (TPR) repeat protein
VNNDLFNQATYLYSAGDHRGALKEYTACLKDTSVPFKHGELGLIYHRIGNCLVKLKNPDEAIKAYLQAAADESYTDRSTLLTNIGMTYASQRDFPHAVEYFQQACDAPNCKNAYKAYMGLGNAQLKMGKTAEAGHAFREAALDMENPDPARALLNLGVCFMALGRPADAVASYKSAFEFDMAPATRNRLNASLGQAYAAQDQAADAVEAFNAATQDGTYTLSDSAVVDYQRCVAALSRAAADETQVLDLADISGLDISTDGYYLDAEDAQDPFYYDDASSLEETGQFPGYVDALTAEEGEEDRFFTATDAELEQWSKDLAKKDRKRRNVGLKILVFIILLVIVALGAGVYAFWQGYGFPTQEAVAAELFANPEAAAQTVFSDALSAESVQSMIAPVVQDSNATIDGVNRSMSDSTVFVTATTEEGGSITYKVSMVRNLIGWKISSVDLYFASQG